MGSGQLVGARTGIIGPRPEYPQTTVDKVAPAFELDFVYLLDCLLVCLWANIINSLHILLFSPLLRNSKKCTVMNHK